MTSDQIVQTLRAFFVTVISWRVVDDWIKHVVFVTALLEYAKRHVGAVLIVAPTMDHRSSSDEGLDDMVKAARVYDEYGEEVDGDLQHEDDNAIQKKDPVVFGNFGLVAFLV